MREDFTQKEKLFYFSKKYLFQFLFTKRRSFKYSSMTFYVIDMDKDKTIFEQRISFFSDQITIKGGFKDEKKKTNKKIK